MLFHIERYFTENGICIFDNWLDSLRDKQAIARISTRLDRIIQGNFGDCKMLESGVWELRIDYGPGYRVYYGKTGKIVVLLLSGGDKRMQNNDIKKAIAYFEDYKRRSL